MEMTLEALYRRFLDSSGVSTDTRTIQAGQIFFALSGPNFDGNAYASAALDKGADIVVVTDPALSGDKVVVVPDALETLQDLARYHRDRLQMPVIGLTGSNGKTTTKELIRDVLASKYSVYATRGNLNNHIGVPLSVLNIPTDVDYAVIEMGANHQGEIALLSSICKPSFGLITNIGKAHLEGFGGIEGVKKGKSEIYHFLADSGGTAFVNLSEAFLDELSAHVESRIFYGLFDPESDSEKMTEATYAFSLDRSSPFIEVSVIENGTVLRSPLFGPYNAQNVATSVAIGMHFGVPLREIQEALANYAGGDNRSQILSVGGKTVVLDAYNANPTSMTHALTHFAEGYDGRKAVILGGMNELGEDSTLEHSRLVDFVDGLAFDEVILVGHHFNQLGIPKRFRHFQTTEEALNFVQGNALEVEQILIKGSRSNALEVLVDGIH